MRQAGLSNGMGASVMLGLWRYGDHFCATMGHLPVTQK